VSEFVNNISPLSGLVLQIEHFRIELNFHLRVERRRSSSRTANSEESQHARVIGRCCSPGVCSHIRTIVRPINFHRSAKRKWKVDIAPKGDALLARRRKYLRLIARSSTTNQIGCPGNRRATQLDATTKTISRRIRHNNRKARTEDNILRPDCRSNSPLPRISNRVGVINGVQTVQKPNLLHRKICTGRCQRDVFRELVSLEHSCGEETPPGQQVSYRQNATSITEDLIPHPGPHRGPSPTPLLKFLGFT